MVPAAQHGRRDGGAGAASPSAATASTWCASSTRVHAALGLEPGVRGAAGHAHLVERDALARDLERAAVGGGLEHERRRAAGASSSMSARDVGEPSSSSPVTRRVTPSRSASAGEGVQRHHQTGLHVEAAGAAQHAVRRPTNGCVGQRAERPHRVVVAEHQHPGRPPPSRQRRCVRPSRTIRSGVDAEQPCRPRRRRPPTGRPRPGRPTATRTRRARRRSSAASTAVAGPSVHPSGWPARRSAGTARRSAARRTSPASRSRPPAARTTKRFSPPAPCGYSSIGSGHQRGERPEDVVRSAGRPRPRAPPCAPTARS